MEWAWNNTQMLSEYMNKACEEPGRVFEAKKSNAQRQERAHDTHGSEGRVGSQGEWGGR